MAIRPATTVTLIQRRLADAEMADALDPMELIGLHDELARLERKWRMQIAEKSERRQPGDIEKLDAWYKRLDQLLDRALRGPLDDPSCAALSSVRQHIASPTRATGPGTPKL